MFVCMAQVIGPCYSGVTAPRMKDAAAPIGGRILDAETAGDGRT